MLEYVFHCNLDGRGAHPPEGLEALGGRRDEFVSGRSPRTDPERVGVPARPRGEAPRGASPKGSSPRRLDEAGASWIPVRYVARFAEDAIGLPDPTESVASRRASRSAASGAGEWERHGARPRHHMAAQDAYAVKAVKGYSTVVKVTVAQMLTHAPQRHARP